MKADQQAAIEAMLTKQTPATAPVKQMVVCPKCEAAGKPNESEVVCESSVISIVTPFACVRLM